MLATGSEINVSQARTALQRTHRQSGFTASLDDHLAEGTLRGIEPKEHVFTEGDSRTFAYKVVTGALCLYKVVPDGRRQVLDFAYPGDIIGLGSGAIETCNAQATMATRVRCVPVAALRRAAGADPRLALRLLEVLSLELDGMRDHLVCIGQRSATERLMTFLLSLSRRNEAKGGDPETIELRMTRADIGDFLGLTIETVSRTFTKLRSRGLIEIDQGTTIRIVDIERLETFVDGDQSH